MTDRDNVRVQHWLWIIVGISVLVRVLAAFYLGNQIEALPGTHDQLSYDALAQSIVSGKGFTFEQNWYPFTRAHTPTAHWSFLYTLYLAAIYSLLGYHPLVARLIQSVVGGLLLCLLVYSIGRRIAGHKVGLVSAAIVALYAYFIYYNVVLMTETFHIIAMLWVLDLAMRLAEGVERVEGGSGKSRRVHRNLGQWLLLGLGLGIATLQRQGTLLFIPPLYIWLAWTYRRSIWKFCKSAIPSLAITAGMILPWTIRNYIVYHEFLLLNSNAGFAFYWANYPQNGTPFEPPTILLEPKPPLPEGWQNLNEAQLDRLLLRKGLGFVVEDPVHYLLRSLNRTRTFFLFLPLPESSLISNLSRVLSFSISLPFMIYGLILSRKAWRRCLPLYLFVAVHSLIHILSWPGPRYRLPVDAVLIPFAGLALVNVAFRLVRRRTQRDRAKGEVSLP